MQETRKLTRSKKVTEILASVQFGMPSKNCRNFGICRIDTLNRQKNVADTNPPRYGAGVAMIKLHEENILEFAFFKKSIVEETRNDYFKDDSFLVIEDFFFPEAIANAFNQDHIIIKPDVVEVQESAYYLTVIFKDIVLSTLKEL